MMHWVIWKKILCTGTHELFISNVIGYVEFNWIFNVYDEYELKTKYISGQYKLLGMYSLLEIKSV
jgi:hypothetical protein